MEKPKNRKLVFPYQKRRLADPHHRKAGARAKKRFLYILKKANSCPKDEPDESLRIDPLSYFMCTYKSCYFIYEKAKYASTHYLKNHTQFHIWKVHQKDEELNEGVDQNPEKMEEEPPRKKPKNCPAPQIPTYLERYKCVDCFMKLLTDPGNYKEPLPFLKEHQEILGSDFEYKQKFKNGQNSCCKKTRENMKSNSETSTFDNLVTTSEPIPSTSSDVSGATAGSSRPVDFLATRPILANLSEARKRLNDVIDGLIVLAAPTSKQSEETLLSPQRGTIKQAVNSNGGDDSPNKEGLTASDNGVSGNDMSNNRDELDCDVDMQGLATGDPVFGINEVAEAMSSEEVEKLKLELDGLKASKEEITTKLKEQEENCRLLEEKLKGKEENEKLLQDELLEMRKKLDKWISEGKKMSEIEKGIMEDNNLKNKKELEEKAKEIEEREKDLAKKKMENDERLKEIRKSEKEMFETMEKLSDDIRKKAKLTVETEIGKIVKKNEDEVEKLKMEIAEKDKLIGEVNGELALKINEGKGNMARIEKMAGLLETREKELEEKNRELEEKAGEIEKQSRILAEMKRVQEELKKKTGEILERDGKAVENYKTLKRNFLKDEVLKRAGRERDILAEKRLVKSNY